MAVQLRLVNKSHDCGNSEVVLFQRNITGDMDEISVAWKVIKYCGYGCYHPFVYSFHTEISINDGYGNYTAHVRAEPGQLYTVANGPTGWGLSTQGPASSPAEVQVLNGLTRGAIDVNIFRDGALLARKTAVAPLQKTVFQFRPSLCVGVVSQVEQGQSLNSAVLTEAGAELPLVGVARADIVMTGGGGQATPFAFALENIVKV